MTRLAHGVAAMLAVAPAAQDAAPELGRPLARIQVAGAGAWRDAFLPTNLGSLLAAKKATPHTDRWIAKMREMLGPLGAHGAWQVLRDYRGRLEIEIHVDFVKGARPNYRFLVLACLTPDGHTDLAPIEQVVRGLVRCAAGASESIQVLGQPFDVLRNGPESVTLPARRGDGLVMIAAHDLDRQVPMALERLDAMLANRLPARATLSVDVDLNRLGRLAVAESGDDSEERAIAEALFGLSSLGDLSLLVRPSGPRVLVELGASFLSDQRGCLRGLFPDAQGSPTLTHLLPEGATAWKAGRLRLDHLFDSLLDGLAHAFGTGDREKLDAELMRELGVDPIDGFLAHLGDEVLVLGSTSWPENVMRDADDVFEGVCFVFPLAKPAEFHAAWGTLQAAFLGQLGRRWETTDHGNVEIHSGQTGLGSRMYLGVSDGLALIAFGDEGRARMGAVLDRRGREADGSLPVAVQRSLRQAPPGFNGAAVADARDALSYLGVVSECLDELGRGMPELLECQRAVGCLEPVLELLAEHELDKVVTLTGYEDRRWAFRIVW